MNSLKKSMMIAAIFSLTSCFSSQAVVTVEMVKAYFTKTVQTPTDVTYSTFWENSGMLSQEAYNIKDNMPLEGGITALQIAVQVKSYAWLKFLLESNQFPFTTIIKLREKIIKACSTGATPNFANAEMRFINEPLNEDGDTAIILAARAGRYDLVEQLKVCGAYEQQENIAGESAQKLIENKQ